MKIGRFGLTRLRPEGIVGPPVGCLGYTGRMDVRGRVWSDRVLL